MPQARAIPVAHRVERICLILIIFAIAAGIGPRIAFFFLAPGSAENLTGEILIRQFEGFLMVLGYTYLFVFVHQTGLGVLSVLLLVIFFRVLYQLSRRQSILLPELNILLALVMFPLQFFFDLLPGLALAALGVLGMMLIISRQLLFVRANHLWLGSPLVVMAAAAFFLDWPAMVALLLFSAAAAVALRQVQKARLSRATGVSLILVCIPLCQAFSAWLPGAFEYRNAVRFSRVPAMSFCESKSQDALIAAHPECPMAMFAEKCRDGYLSVFHRKTLEHQRDLRLFDQNYYGRLEQLVCHGDQLYLGMNAVRKQGEILGPNAMLVDLREAPPKILRNLAGPQIGNHLLYDEAHDALFLTSEWDARIYRWEFKRQKMDTHIGDALTNPWYWPPTGRTHTGSRISHHEAVSYKYNAGYFSEWINGRYVHEVDLTTLKPRRSFRFNGGASVGATVDDAENKLWVSHLWGVSVFDLGSGKLLAKERLGFVNRPVAIDPINNLVFLASTVQGRLHVFDRQTLRHLSTITLGLGSRYLTVSPELKRLYASSWSGSYYFDLSPTGKFIQDLEKIRKSR